MSAEHHDNNRAFYDRIAGAYDLMSNASEKPARQAGLEALAMQPGQKVLEIGFGTGNEVIDLANLVGTSGLVAGIDISTGMLDVTKKKLSEQSITTPIDLRVGDARQLPWSDGSFDAVYTSFTLELFPGEDIAAVLKESMRVLKPGGKVGVVSMATVKAGESPSALERVYVWMHRHFPHIVDCRPIDAAAVVSAAGFRVAEHIDMKIWTMPVAAVVGEKPA